MNNTYALIKTDHDTKQETEIMFDSFERVAERWLELEAELPHREIEQYRIEGGEPFEREDLFVEELSPKDIESLLPRSLFEWQICPRCEGDGTCLIDGLEGVAFSAEEFNEAFDPEERERYFNGGYDRPCPDCNATGKVLVLDFERFQLRAPLLAKQYQEWLEEEFTACMEYEAERRMGA